MDKIEFERSAITHINNGNRVALIQLLYRNRDYKSRKLKIGLRLII